MNTFHLMFAALAGFIERHKTWAVPAVWLLAAGYYLALCFALINMLSSCQ